MNRREEDNSPQQEQNQEPRRFPTPITDVLNTLVDSQVIFWSTNSTANYIRDQRRLRQIRMGLRREEIRWR